MEERDAVHRADEFVETYESQYRDYGVAVLQSLYAEGVSIHEELSPVVSKAANDLADTLNEASEEMRARKGYRSVQKVDALERQRAAQRSRYESLWALFDRLDKLVVAIKELYKERLTEFLAEGQANKDEARAGDLGRRVAETEADSKNLEQLIEDIEPADSDQALTPSARRRGFRNFLFGDR